MCRSVHVPHNPSRHAPRIPFRTLIQPDAVSLHFDQLAVSPLGPNTDLGGGVPNKAYRHVAPYFSAQSRHRSTGLVVADRHSSASPRRARTRSRRAGEVQSSDSENVCNAPPGKGCNKAGVGSNGKILDDLAMENRWT